MSLTFYKATTVVLAVGVVALAVVCIFDMLIISQQRHLILDLYRYVLIGCPTSW
jgi:hypothetical protein